MNRWELELLISKISYKPGTTFELKPYESSDFRWKGLRVLITQRVPNAKDPRSALNIIYVGEGFTEEEIDAGITMTQVAARIREYLIAMETHEVNEWFKIAGNHVVDPHPEETRRREQDRAAAH